METLELLLQRKIHNKTSTEGNLLVDANWFCHTIEDVVRAKPNEWKPSLKVYGKTAIPYGRYQVLVTYSNRFKRDLTAVLNVPDFEGIRIHNGVNETSSAGCIIVSYKAAKGKLINERNAMNDLCNKVQAATKAGKKVWLTITD
jgi:hypothetical protein